MKKHAIIRLAISIVLLVSMLATASTAFAQTPMANVAYGATADPSKYVYSDQVTELKLDVGSMDYSHVQISGNHMVWSKLVSNYEQIYYGNLKTGKAIQITDDKSRKSVPAVTETGKGTFIVWADNLNYTSGPSGRDIFSYQVETKTRTKLNQTDGHYYEAPAADQNHVVWSSKDESVPTLRDYDLSTGKESVIGKGTNPILGGGILFYNNYEGGYHYYRFDNRETSKMGASFIDQVSFNGRYVLGKQRIHANAQYMVFEADRPNSLGITVIPNGPSQISKLMTGDSFGVVAEKVDGKVKMTGVDLLYQITFPMQVNTTFEKIIGFSNDKLVYLDEANRVVLRTIQAPLNRSNRASDPIHVIIEGKEIAFHVPPIQVNGTTLVEMRPVFEQLGFDIKWDGETNTVTGTKGSLKIQLTKDRKTAVMNGKSVQLDAAPAIENGYTYVPLRFIGEAADRRVTWNQELHTAYISPKDTSDTLYYDNGMLKYIGDLVDGKRQGTGTSWHERTGNLEYKGEWKNDKRDGQGRMFYESPNDLFFEGTWAEGKQVEGTEYFPGGVLRYKGTYRNGRYETGTAVYTYNTGKYLVGEIKDGRLNGHGVLYYPNGRIEFEGTFKDSIMSYGKLYDEAGKLIYEGEFDENGDPKVQQ